MSLPRVMRVIGVGLFSILILTTVLSGCSATAENVAGRSLEQAKDNLVRLSNGFFPGSDIVEVVSGPLQVGCKGALAAASGPPFRWEYNAAVPYSPQAAAAAKGVVDSLVANGWSVKVRDLKQDDTVDYTLSDGSGVLVGVTIPNSGESEPPLPAPTIQAGGSSECAE